MNLECWSDERPLCVFGVIVALAVGAPRAESCTILCGDKPPTLSYRYVLLGKVVETRRDGNQAGFVIEPVRVWNGGWPGDAGRFRVTTEASGASCGYGLVDGAYYVIVASTEPQKMGLCDHQPLPLVHASKTITELDRAREFPPLKLPKEAFLSPAQLQCPPASVDAMIDRHLDTAELVVRGHLAGSEAYAPDNRTSLATLNVTRSLKGRATRPVRVETIRYADDVVTKDSVWFLGARRPDGVRRVTHRWAIESERGIVSRIERWKVLGRGCVISTTPIR